MRISLIGLSSLSLSLWLTGCATAPVPAVTPSTSSGSTPVASPATEQSATPNSDDEARARQAFDDYVAASDTVLQSGGKHVEALKTLVTAQWFEAEVSGFDRIREAGVRQVGDTLITLTELAYVAHDSGETEVALYACQSTENLRIVDADDVTVSGPPATTLVTVFVRLTDTTALVDAISPAADSSWCLTQ